MFLYPMKNFACKGLNGSPIHVWYVDSLITMQTKILAPESTANDESKMKQVFFKVVLAFNYIE